MALEICGITEGGAGKDLRDQQLGHFAGEETEARREECQVEAYKAVTFIPALIHPSLCLSSAGLWAQGQPQSLQS